MPEAKRSPAANRVIYVVPSLVLTALVSAALAVPAAQAAPAKFAGSSASGSKVFFTTTDKLVPGDTDRGFQDVYERSYDPEVGIETYVTHELSTGLAGGNDAYPASYEAASATGEQVFFSTQEPLVSADRDRAVDVYMRNTTTGATTLISRGAASCEASGCGNGPSEASFKSVTSDGSRVFFQTTESLAPEDTDAAGDVYMRNLEAEPPTTVLVSRAGATCAGGCGNGPEGATFAGASANGKRVFFETAESLVPEDSDSTGDLYMRNLEAGLPATTLITTAGTCPEGASASECKPKFRGASADGSRAFFTTSEKLSSEDQDGHASDVYLWEEGTISLVSTGPAIANEADKPATFAGSRGNGGLVFFQTGEGLTGADNDGGATDVYVRDLEAAPPTTTLVSQADPGCVEAGSCGAGPSSETFAGASANGGTVFIQTTERLSPEDGDTSSDVYARDISGGTTTLVSAPGPSCEGEACGPPAPAVFAGASADGSIAFFTTEASLVAEDAESEDVYRRDLGTSTTTLESVAGVCPLPGETGCDASFAGASEDGSHLFFTTVRRLTARDGDSEVDVYEREGSRTRLVSDSNSVTLGPATPVLTALFPGSTGETTTPAVRGQGTGWTAGIAIKVYETADCSGEAVVGSVEALEGGGIQVTVPAGTTTSITATATDEAGVTSDCSNVLNYTQQAAAPPAEEGSGGGGGSGSGGGETVSGGTGASGPVPTSGSGGSGGTGSPGGSGASGSFKYVRPLTRITFGPAFKTRTRHPVFRFLDATGQPGTRFFCRLDRQHWKGCSSPARLNHLRFGRHTFRVKALNAIGEWEAKPTARTFKLVGAGG
ncbi:MAG TPA: hypothetical protein VFN85_05725 [Solirubrobacterales bacterium]|nr:hypothetical protein [Solirubrobacterales bacterium]